MSVITCHSYDLTLAFAQPRFFYQLQGDIISSIIPSVMESAIEGSVFDDMSELSKA